MSPGRPRFDWYQDDSALSVVLYEEAVQPDSLRTEWENGILRITYKTLNGSAGPLNDPATISRSCELRLCSPIVDPAKAASGYSHTCSKKKIEMRFRKATAGHWQALEASDVPVSSTIGTYSKIDENLVEQHIAESDENREEKGFVEMLQEIYANGDENTRRAMNKSFQSSNGSVLSTDWSKVSEGNAQ